MIWFQGEVRPDDEVSVPVLDRVFEHGLGLFETLRTWSGRALLLDRHLVRLLDSAQALRLPLDSSSLPGHDAVARLREAAGLDGDTVLRITVSGGRKADTHAGVEPSSCLAWMTLRPLPPPAPSEGWTIGYGLLRVDESDPLARHKTLNYWARLLAYQRARESDAHERLVFTADGRVWEGTRTNLFMVRHGAVWTPPLKGPVLPGVMRAIVLELGAHLDLESHTHEMNLATLEHAEEIFLTSSVRGIVPVGRLYEQNLDAPGPVTRRLQAELQSWLEAGAPPR